MRKLMKFIVLSGLILGGCTSVKEYVIRGEIAGNDAKLYLSVVNEQGKFDTIQQVESQKGKFQIKGILDNPKIGFLTVQDRKGRIPLMLKDTIFDLKIKGNDLGDVRNFSARGGVLQNRKDALDRKEENIYRERDSVLARFYRANEEDNIFGKMHEMASLQVMDEIYDKEENEYIQKNRDNILGLYLVFYRHSYLNYERLKLKFDMLSEEMKHTPEGQVIDKRYKKLSEVKVGAYAPNFKLPTLDGDSVHLYGKSATIKIIDFWASWCGPCRKENPHLVEIYKKYKDKDLLMISVSMDTDEKAWRKAVKEDGLEWIQACDLQGADGKAVRAYRVTGIPHIFVLDGNNKIIGEKLKGQELDDLLAKYLK